MLSPEILEEFNKRLIDRFGYLYDKPKYQVRWSNSCHELRYVEGNRFIGKVYLGPVIGTQSMPKYPKNQDRYVLEILVPVPDNLKHELPGDAGNGITYEPLFFFEKKGQYVEPNWNLICVIAFASHYPIDEVYSPEFELWKMEKADLMKSLDILDDTLPDLAVAMRRGHAAFIDSTKTFGGVPLIGQSAHLIGEK